MTSKKLKGKGTIHKSQDVREMRRASNINHINLKELSKIRDSKLTEEFKRVLSDKW